MCLSLDQSIEARVQGTAPTATAYTHSYRAVAHIATVFVTGT